MKGGLFRMLVTANAGCAKQFAVELRNWTTTATTLRDDGGSISVVMSHRAVMLWRGESLRFQMSAWYRGASCSNANKHPLPAAFCWSLSWLNASPWQIYLKRGWDDISSAWLCNYVIYLGKVRTKKVFWQWLASQSRSIPYSNTPLAPKTS